jgi:hypothetical protein
MNRHFQFRLIKFKLISQEINTQHCLNSELWVQNFGNSNAGCKMFGQTKQLRTEDKQFLIVIRNPCKSTLPHKIKSDYIEFYHFYHRLNFRHLVGFLVFSKFPTFFLTNDNMTTPADSICLMLFCIQLNAIARTKRKSCAV